MIRTTSWLSVSPSSVPAVYPTHPHRHNDILYTTTDSIMSSSGRHLLAPSSERKAVAITSPLLSNKARISRSQSFQLGAQPASDKQVVTHSVVLVGDIGGTNARLATMMVSVSNSATSSKELFFKVYPTSQYSSFEAVMREFLSEQAVKDAPPHAAALAIAGAVNGNRCQMTNVKWLVDGPALESMFGFSVQLLNDFEAVGYGIPVLKEEDVVPINNAPAVPKAPKVVMGPGTGLGAAQLMWDEGLNRYKVWPGEGAHAKFAPRGWKQQALSNFVVSKFGFCEIEQVACGSGLELIYEFLLTDEEFNRPKVLRKAQKKTAAEITAAVLEGTDPLATEAVDMFLAIVGAEASAMALRCLARGGVYVAGGITPRLMSQVQEGALLQAFLMQKGREPFHKILASTPLFVITNTKVGQLGATEVARQLLLAQT